MASTLRRKTSLAFTPVSMWLMNSREGLLEVVPSSNSSE